MGAGKASRGLKLAEGLLFAGGLLCFAYVLQVAAHAAASNRISRGIGIAAPVEPAPAGPSAQQSDGGKASVVGRLEIPALKLSVPILSDDDPSSLMKGVGHIPGTATLGGLGNAGLAGHRDMYLRPLRGISARMEIRATDHTGRYRYQVDSTEIVTPDQVRVLDIGSRPELTLVTCYPFYYVGNAPKRFIVHAHLISAMPDPTD